MNHNAIMTMVNDQARKFNAMVAELKAGRSVTLNPSLHELTFAIDTYKLMAKPTYKVAAVRDRVIGLPYSLGGEHVVPYNVLLSAFGLGVVERDYKDLVVADEETGSTVSEIVVVRPNGTKHGGWVDLMDELVKLCKERKITQDKANEIIDAEYQIFPGVMVTCAGWREGTLPEAKIHRCGNVVMRKEGYHGFRCDACHKAFNSWRDKKRAGKSVTSRVVVNRLRLKLK